MTTKLEPSTQTHPLPYAARQLRFFLYCGAVSSLPTLIVLCVVLELLLAPLRSGGSMDGA